MPRFTRLTLSSWSGEAVASQFFLWRISTRIMRPLTSAPFWYIFWTGLNTGIRSLLICTSPSLLEILDFLGTINDSQGHAKHIIVSINKPLEAILTPGFWENESAFAALLVRKILKSIFSSLPVPPSHSQTQCPLETRMSSQSKTASWWAFSNSYEQHQKQCIQCPPYCTEDVHCQQKNSRLPWKTFIETSLWSRSVICVKQMCPLEVKWSSDL